MSNPEIANTAKIRSIIPCSMLAWLLHYANAQPCYRPLFYDLKTRILKRFGTFHGHDIQEITKECFGCFDSMGDPRGCDGATCRKCGGTGIYDQRWIRLQRWSFGKYLFHIPDGSTWIKPDSVQIVGRIEHEDYGRASREAELWLYLATFQFKTWWLVASTSSYCSPGWWPMCRIQKIAMWARMTFSWQRCYCGKRFPTWGKGWQMCKKCRRPSAFPDYDEPPF